MIRSTVRVVAALIGWALLALAVDVGLGAAVESAHPRIDEEDLAPPAAPPVDAPDESVDDRSGPCLGELRMPAEALERAAAPAYGEAPWVEEYWCEFYRIHAGYVPYLYTRLDDTRQPLINSQDGVRRSYQASDRPDDAPVVWFFGGSTMWGWGQRDQHTIPSEVARLAERAGAPIEAVNFGQLAWMHWQEVLAFEQELATRPAPDLVVFYDGVNDVNVQTYDPGPNGGRPSDDPTVYRFERDPSPQTAPTPEGEPAPEPTTWAEWWGDTSAMAQLTGGLGDRLFGIDAAGASESGRSQSADADTALRRVVDIYERGQALADGVAARHGLRPLYFWQPREAEGVTAEVHRGAVDRMGASIIDLTALFDDRDPDGRSTPTAPTPTKKGPGSSRRACGHTSRRRSTVRGVRRRHLLERRGHER